MTCAIAIESGRHQPRQESENVDDVVAVAVVGVVVRVVVDVVRVVVGVAVVVDR